jgi:hypothetical protein
MGVSKEKKQARQTLDEFLDKHLCVFCTGAKRCQLLGVIGDEQGSRFLCGWHHAAESDIRFAANYEEFIQWREKQRERHPLTDIMTYMDDEVVWRACLGTLSHIDFVESIAMPRIEDIRKQELEQFCRQNDLPYPVVTRDQKQAHIDFYRNKYKKIGTAG